MKSSNFTKIGFCDGFLRICKNFKISFFTEYLQTATSERYRPLFHFHSKHFFLNFDFMKKLWLLLMFTYKVIKMFLRFICFHWLFCVQTSCFNKILSHIAPSNISKCVMFSPHSSAAQLLDQINTLLLWDWGR